MEQPVLGLTNADWKRMSQVLEEFRGKRVLVVENEYLLAREIQRQLEASGAAVVGPVPSVAQALELIDDHQIDVAILDVQLDAETSFPIANALEAKGIPFVFATAYAQEQMPERYCRFVVSKPVGLQAIAQKLFGDRPH